MKIDSPKGAKFITETLEKSGYEAYVVGGCVRDAIMGREPGDWDICTSALPEKVAEVFENLTDAGTNYHIHVVPTGIKHGTVTIVLRENAPETYEVTTFRSDGEYKDRRRPESVEFVRDVNEDLKRRDFTMNAIAYSFSEEKLIDPFGGMDDINNKIIKCVGDPGERFGEDALRIMRAVRFSSQLGFSIEGSTEEAMNNGANLLGHIAAERIRVESDKLLCGADAASVLRKHRRIIKEFIPEIEPMFELDQENPFHLYDVWEHTLHAVDNIEPDVVLRLAAFFHDIGKPPCKIVDKGWGHFYGHERVGSRIADAVMHRLKYDNRTRKTVVNLIDRHGIVFNPAGKQASRLLHRLGEENLRRLISLERADVKSQHPNYVDERLAMIAAFEEKVDYLIEQGKCFSMKDMAVDGRDLIALGVEEGKEIGRIKSELLRLVVDGELENSRDALIDKAKELLCE
ncbi:MAG: HD domain-containing protein [Firmicutes bacterium]|nr:HD domain-containing protein [Bacillota bacterium]